MPESAIGELPQADYIDDSDLIPLEQGGEAMHITGEQLKAFIDRNVLGIRAQTLPVGSDVTASYNAETGILTLGIPRSLGAANSVDGVAANTSGDVPLGAVSYDRGQSLTAAQKARARANLGLLAGAIAALPLSIANGGSGADSAAGARKNLGLDYLPKRNLLDNWFFGQEVINQRGQSAGSSVAGYYIDRWKSNGAASVNIANGYLHMKSAAILFQPSVPSIGSDQRITFSYWDKGVGTVYSVSGLLNSYTSVGGLSVSFNRSTQVFYMRADRDVAINAVKLEIGDTQTLAYQDASGNWQLVDVPDYSEELFRCQRYLCRLNGSTVRYPKAQYTTDIIDFTVSTPRTMAKRSGSIILLSGSTLKVYGKASASDSFTEQEGFTFSVTYIDGNALNIRASKSSHGIYYDAFLNVSNVLISCES